MANATGKGLQNLGSLRRKLRALPDDLRAAIRAEFEAAAAEMEAEMKERVPKDTGTLEGLISSKVSADGFSAKIGFRGKRASRKGYYAKFQEFGTVDTPAQPFMVPAFEAVAPKAVKRIRKRVNQALADAGKRK